ncbi:chromosome segregation protein SMC [Streptomyces sp. Root63]|uniref:AAA family ATPase n=1 Tax=unclassified Streptomyces TaxID=2593676 RepID=UPI0006FB5350|nr:MULTISPECIES: AAA family ATPase [unclassified Streptomyces]KQX43896.1 chromosome segregation protein SMC [Streptomyces sp. Root1295]KRA34466.1 chromosome segregation protein SMC [Streptomyces sp. Root63]
MTDQPPASLRALLLDRLDDSGLAPEVRELLRELLPDERARGTGGCADPVQLRSITAGGWRGIGPRTTLELPPGPGLVVVAGPNGSGKSSFAEAAETAITGRNSRWEGRRAGDWQKGWRNLHSPDVTPEIGVELTVGERGEAITVRRTWFGTTVTEARTKVEGADRSERKLEEVIDPEALDLARPFLPYSELGSMINGTLGGLHDAFFKLLGLELLADFDGRVKDAVGACDQVIKRADALTADLLTELAALDDPRAREAAQGLSRSTRDLDRVRALLEGRDAAAESELARLRQYAGLDKLDLREVGMAVERLRDAAAHAEDARYGRAEEARRLVGLLEAALEQQRRSQTTDCPVCGAEQRLDRAWAESTRAEVDRLRTDAEDAAAARQKVADAVRAAHGLVQPVPVWLRGEASAFASVWQEWTQCRDVTHPRELADRIQRTATALDEACRQMREEAARRLAEHDGAWQPTAVRLAEWLGAEEAAESARGRRKHARKARTWLRPIIDELRDERLRPFAQRSQEVWQQLCEHSSVTLGSVTLAGTPGRGKVELDVSVDEMSAPAYSVMSQGELHSLALSLFLPRATHAASPFGFLVIDDPVQSMDPEKVEGLARVLDACARDRQVIVFTHDTRLQQAIAHLGIEATVLRITRQTDSVVGVETLTDPVDQALAEARAVSLDPGLPQDVADHVLPAMCRVAVEAACLETARRRLRDEQGLGLRAVEERVGSLERTKKYVSLALLGDAGRYAREAVERIHPGGWALIEAFNSGSHAPLPTVDDRKRLVRRTTALATAIQASTGTQGSGGAR